MLFKILQIHNEHVTSKMGLMKSTSKNFPYLQNAFGIIIN